MNLIAVLSQFDLPAAVLGCEVIHHGHIHDTHRIELRDGQCYILQAMNTTIFTQPHALMANVVAISHHLISTLPTPMQPIEYIASLHSSYVVEYEGTMYRLMRSIEPSVTYQHAPSLDHINACGRAVGTFQKALADFNASTLVEVLPHFHHTVSRYHAFEKAVQTGDSLRLAHAHGLICRLKHRQQYARLIVDALASGRVLLRVTHNDTKLNNFLFDPNTCTVKAIIDWDTIMPGSILYDVGDALRAMGNTIAEDQTNGSKAQFSLAVFSSFLSGFLAIMKSELTAGERELLAMAPLVITYELALRFLSDYLTGDTYFAADYDTHNYDRASVQLQLLESMEQQQPAMKRIVADLLR